MTYQDDNQSLLRKIIDVINLRDFDGHDDPEVAAKQIFEIFMNEHAKRQAYISSQGTEEVHQLRGIAMNDIRVGMQLISTSGMGPVITVAGISGVDEQVTSFTYTCEPYSIKTCYINGQPVFETVQGGTCYGFQGDSFYELARMNLSDSTVVTDERPSEGDKTVITLAETIVEFPDREDER